MGAGLSTAATAAEHTHRILRAPHHFLTLRELENRGMVAYVPIASGGTAIARVDPEKWPAQARM